MSNPHTADTTHSLYRKRLAIAISAIFVGVLLAFLGIVLPAKFDRDPLGLGALLGITNLANHTAALTEQYEFHKQEEVEFILEPFQSLEYKYLMDKGNTLVYSWQADGELYFDLNADNFTIQDGETSYLQGDSTQHMGAYKAAFNGMHGWFWENRSFQTVRLRIKTAGFYVSSTLYGNRRNNTRDIAPVF